MTTPDGNLTITYKSTAESPITSGDNLEIPFDFRKSSQIKIKYKDSLLVEGKDYTVTIGLETTDTNNEYDYKNVYGIVTLNTDISVGESVEVYRSTDRTQESSLKDKHTIDLKEIEESLDKLTMIAQEQDNNLVSNVDEIRGIAREAKDIAVSAEEKITASEEHIQSLSEELKSEVQANTESINTALNTIEDFKTSTNQNITEFKTSTQQDIDEFKNNTNQTVTDLEEYINNSSGYFKAQYGITSYDKVLKVYKQDKQTIYAYKYSGATDYSSDFYRLIEYKKQYGHYTFVFHKILPLLKESGIVGSMVQEYLWLTDEDIWSYHYEDLNLSDTVDKDTFREQIIKKQDIIMDLEDIREGATLGSTALQSYTETDPIYIADKPKIALKSEIPTVPTNVSAFANDAGYLTEHQDISNLATKDEIPTIPTKVSAFTNDVGYLTKHQDISNLATKDEVSAIASSSLKREIVNNLPPVSSAVENVIYLVPSEKQEDMNARDEYLFVNGAFELIGTTKVDLSNYYNKDEVNTKLDTKQDTIVDIEMIREGAELGATALQEETDPIYTADKPSLALKSEIPDISGKADKSEIPVVNNPTIKVTRNDIEVGSFSLNQTDNKDINIEVPETAEDVGALPDSTKYGSDVDLSIDRETSQISVTLKDQSGNPLSETKTITYPLAPTIVSGHLDTETNDLVLVLDGGEEIRVPVSDLLNGLQLEITEDNKLSADLLTEGETNKLVTQLDIDSWNNKITLEEVPKDIFIATDKNTNAEVYQAYQEGKMCFLLYSNRYHTLAGTPTSTTAYFTSCWTTAGHVSSISMIYMSTSSSGKTNITGTNTNVANADLSNLSTQGSHRFGLKQDVIEDLEAIRAGAELGATALQSYTETDPIYMADKPNIALKSEIKTKTSELTNDSDFITSAYHDDTKQDVIDDLYIIRSGAQAGSTALQSETDPVYTADKPNIALKSEIPDISGKADKTEIPDITPLATKTELNTKQDVLTAGDNITIENNTISAKSGGLPIGSEVMVPATSDYVPEGCLLKDGSEYTKEQFPDLWENQLTKGYGYNYKYSGSWSKTVTWSPIIKDVIYGNNTFVAVAYSGTDGYIYKSTDGSTWISRGPFANEKFLSVAFGNGTFVIVGDVSYVYYSTDNGNTWEKSSSTISGDTFNAVRYINNKFVAVGNQGQAWFSIDGITWTKSTPTDTFYAEDIAYGNGVYVAVGYTANSSRTIATSTNERTWTTKTFTGTYFYKIIYANKLFVAIGSAGLIITSTDGSTWTQQTVGSSDWLAIEYINNTFVVVGTAGSIATSDNGIEWYNQSVGDSSYISVVHGNNTFVVVGANGSITTSTDGSTWTNSTIGEGTFQSIAFGNDIFVAVNYTGYIAYSLPLTLKITQLPTLSYTDYATQIENFGLCESFAIDTDNGRFKVPYKVSSKRFLVKSYKSGSNWYNLYSDGWCEQGGKIARSGASQSISLHKAYKDTNYSIFMQPYHTSASTDGRPTLSYEATSSSGKTTSAFIYNSYTAYAGCYWRTCGYTSTVYSPVEKYYVAVANAQVNQSQMDWSAWASNLNSKANIDGSNWNTSVKNVDGQWISSVKELSTATAVGTYEIDLSDYLPDDNYNYEIFIHSGVHSGASESYTAARGVKIFGGDIIEDSIIIGHVQRYGVYNENSFKYPVKSRKINITIYDGKLSSHNMKAYAFRRIGTNN